MFEIYPLGVLARLYELLQEEISRSHEILDFLVHKRARSTPKFARSTPKFARSTPCNEIKDEDLPKGPFITELQDFLLPSILHIYKPYDKMYIYVVGQLVL